MFIPHFLDELKNEQLSRCIVMYFSNSNIDIYSNPAYLIKDIDLKIFEKQSNVTKQDVADLLEVKKMFENL
jgi:hypothetical protein